jgi:hypothetical protein
MGCVLEIEIFFPQKEVCEEWNLSKSIQMEWILLFLLKWSPP